MPSVVLGPGCELVVEVAGRVREGGEDDHLAVAGLIGLRHLSAITRAESASLASRPAPTSRAAPSRVARRLRSSTRSCRQRMRSTS